MQEAARTALTSAMAGRVVLGMVGQAHIDRRPQQSAGAHPILSARFPMKPQAVKPEGADLLAVFMFVRQFSQNSFVGFKMPFGSNALLMPRMSSIFSGA